MKKTMRVKEWLVNRIDEEARGYNRMIDINKDREFGAPAIADEDGCLTIYVEEIESESEKAYKCKLGAETMNGAVTTWSAWIAKSQIVEVL